MSKIKKLYYKMNENKKILKNFGIKFAFYNFLESIVSKNSVESKFNKKVHKKSYDYICKYLEEKYRYICEKYTTCSETDKYINEKCPIFLLWWQGKYKMPINIKICVNSIIENNPNHKVYVIDKDNYKDFIKIPEYVIEKFEKNIIGIAHFSDIIRLALLKEHGGIWIDSTFFLTRNFDSHMYNYKFYTIKHGLHSDFHVCKGKWTVGLLCAGKNNKLIQYLYECLCEYWKIENVAICYLLLDCFIRIAYENLNFAKEEIDVVPINNSNTFRLEEILSKTYYEGMLDIYKNTYIFRLTYKKEFEKFINGSPTLYNEILKNNLKGI